jgi:hypothetical protein
VQCSAKAVRRGSNCNHLGWCHRSQGRLAVNIFSLMLQRRQAAAAVLAELCLAIQYAGCVASSNCNHLADVGIAAVGTDQHVQALRSATAAAAAKLALV